MRSGKPTLATIRGLSPLLQLECRTWIQAAGRRKAFNLHHWLRHRVPWAEMVVRTLYRPRLMIIGQPYQDGIQRILRFNALVSTQALFNQSKIPGCRHQSIRAVFHLDFQHGNRPFKLINRLHKCRL